MITLFKRFPKLGNIFFLPLCFWLFPSLSHAQLKKNALVESYINQYKDWAMEEQIRSGVPASITLAQGILESGAGESELALMANNHFGIKCKKNWNGPSYLKDDDAPSECFRKYASSYESFRDHSDFLKGNSRYQKLFNLAPDQYKQWAHGLQKAGYATNKQYAKRLIDYIETYQLDFYTLLAADKNQNPSERLLAATNLTAQEAHQLLHEEAPAGASEKEMGGAQKNERDRPLPEDTGNLSPDWSKIIFYEPTTLNGLKGFYGKKGDLLLDYALTNRISYAKLLRINDLEDVPLKANMFIYTEKKLKSGLAPSVVVPNGMDLAQVSQATGVELAQLRQFNRLKRGEEVAAGTLLYLQDRNAIEVDSEKQKKGGTHRVVPLISSDKHPSINERRKELSKISPIVEAPLDTETEGAEITEDQALEDPTPAPPPVVEAPQYIYITHDEDEETPIEAGLRKSIPEVQSAPIIGSEEAGGKVLEPTPGVTTVPSPIISLKEEGVVREAEPKLEDKKHKDEKKGSAKKEEKQAKPQDPPENLSPLEKLRWKMDQIVYGTEGAPEKSIKQTEALLNVPETTSPKLETPEISNNTFQEAFDYGGPVSVKEEDANQRKSGKKKKTPPGKMDSEPLAPQVYEGAQKAKQAAAEEEAHRKEIEENLSPSERLKRYMDEVEANREESSPPEELTPMTTIPAGQNQSMAPTPEPATSGAKYYVVKRGDTAYSIAKAFYISLAELKAWNHLSDNMTLYVGTRLRVAP